MDSGRADDLEQSAAADDRPGPAAAEEPGDIASPGTARHREDPKLLPLPGSQQLGPYTFDDDDDDAIDGGGFDRGATASTGRSDSADSTDRSKRDKKTAFFILAGILGLAIAATAFRPSQVVTTATTSTTRSSSPDPSTADRATVTSAQPVDEIDPEALFLERLQSSGAASELERMIAPSPGESRSNSLLALGVGICGELTDGATVLSLEEQLMQAIVDQNGSAGSTAPGASGRAAIAELVRDANQYLCPETVAPIGSPTTTQRPTTTTIQATTTTPRSVGGVVRNPCRDVPCKVYLRADPNGDISRPSDSYYLDGDAVAIICRTTAQRVRDGDTGQSSPVWYRTDDGFFIAGLYVEVRETPETC